MLLAISRIVLFILSTNSLCWGVYGAVNSCQVACVSRLNLNAFEVYSFPPSVHKIFIAIRHCFSIMTLNFLKLESTSSLDLIKYNHIILLYSSTKEVKYFFPPREGTSKGPHTLECITFSTFDVVIGK